MTGMAGNLAGTRPDNLVAPMKKGDPPRGKGGAQKISTELRAWGVEAATLLGDKLHEQGQTPVPGATGYFYWVGAQEKGMPHLMAFLRHCMPREIRVDGEITLEKVVSASFARAGIPLPTES